MNLANKMLIIKFGISQIHQRETAELTVSILQIRRQIAYCNKKRQKILAFLSEKIIFVFAKSGSSSVVEHNLAKVGVASSNLVSRSFTADFRRLSKNCVGNPGGKKLY